MLKNLKDLRKEVGLSQKQVAEILNISQQTYSDYENCKTEPTSDTLLQIAICFGVSVDELLGREDDKNLIERPPYEITDKQLLDFMKLFKVMTEIQKAQVLGYVIALLEQSGVNVKTILR